MGLTGKVLVTGGSGLVGRAIQDETRSSNTHDDQLEFVFLSKKDGDLTQYDETEAIFLKFKPDYVIHLAAKVGGLYANMNENEEFYTVNRKINENVLRLAWKFKVKKCFSCLSTCIFPSEIEYPLDESKVSSSHLERQRLAKISAILLTIPGLSDPFRTTT